MGFNGLMKLNIQLFAAQCTVSVSETTSVSNNTSTFTITAKVTTDSTTYNQTSSGAYVQGSYSGGASGSLSKQSFKIAKSSSVTKTWTVSNVPHNSDGTLGQITFSVTWYVTSSSTSHGTTTKSINPSTIPRYANITSFTVSMRDETSVTYSYTADASCDWAWYSLNGSNWYNLPNSGVVSGLSAGTQYGFYLKLRRTDSQLTSTAGPVYQSTYYYPHVTGCTSGNIGDPFTLVIYNPLGRTYTAERISLNNNQVIGSYTGTINGNLTGFNSQGDINAMYASIPNNTKGQYKTRVTYSPASWVHDNDSRGKGEYYAVQSECTPTFSDYDWGDINPTTLALTGDSSIVVKGYSNIQATIPVADKAIAKNYASITKYSFANGQQSQDIAYSSSADVTGTINNVLSDTFQIRAIDSRGYPSNYVTKTANTFINYYPLGKTSATLERVGEVSSQTTLSFSGTIWNDSFGDITNSIKSVVYEYKTGTGTWQTGSTTITPTVTNDTFSFTGLILGDDVDGFDVQNVYEVKVTVADELSSVEWTFTLPSGNPHLAWYKDGLSVMGKYDETRSDALQVHGDINISGNYLKNGNNILEKSAVTARMSSDFTIINANTNYQLPIDTVVESVGTKLTVDNNGITIGDGVSYVLVSGQVYWYNSVSGAECICYIYKNNSNQLTHNTYMTDNYEHSSLPLKLLKVNQGDVISLRVYREAAGGLIKYYDTGTFLTVVAIA